MPSVNANTLKYFQLFILQLFICAHELKYFKYFLYLGLARDINLLALWLDESRREHLRATSSEE